MSKAIEQRSCLHLAACQDRPTCAECTDLHSRGREHERAVRVERLINSRYQHTTFDAMPPSDRRANIDGDRPRIRAIGDSSGKPADSPLKPCAVPEWRPLASVPARSAVMREASGGLDTRGDRAAWLLAACVVGSVLLTAVIAAGVLDSVILALAGWARGTP